MARLDSSSEELDENEYAVEKIIKDRIIKVNLILNKGKHKYYIKWEGYSDKYNSWIEKKDLSCSKLLQDYHQTKGSKSSKPISPIPTKKQKKSEKTDDKSNTEEEEILKHDMPPEYGKWESLKPNIITIQMRENSTLHVELQL